MTTNEGVKPSGRMDVIKQVKIRGKIKALLWRFVAGMAESASQEDRDQLITDTVDKLIRIDPPGWLTEREVAARYPFTVRWLRRARWEGIGPAFHRTQLGARWSRVYYSTVDIEAFLDTCRVNTKSES